MEQSYRLGDMVMAGAIAVAEVITMARVEAVATIMAGVGAVTMVGCD